MDRSPASPSPSPALEPVRERVVRQLCEHFAADHLTAEGLEERLDLAHQATTAMALTRLVADLPALPPPSPVPGAAGYPAPHRAEQVAERQVVVALMGGASRKGAWTPPQQLFVVAVMGGAELDFRQARFGPGVTEVSVFALMGGVDIVVPPGVQVEMNGVAVMGAFEQTGRVDAPLDPRAPVLRIGGLALMAGVDVRCRLPGERASDARRREKLEAEQARRLPRG